MKLIIKNGVLKKIKGGKDLTGLEIPEGVTEISPKAFKGCPSLEKITIPGSIRTVDATLVDTLHYGGSRIQNIEIKEGVQAIEERSFAHKGSLKTISFPNSLIRIGESAFVSCNNIEEIIIPGNVESVGRGAFSFCKSLKNVEFQEGIKRIDGEAFEHCVSIRNLVIPGSVESVGDQVFAGCKSLETVQIKEGVKRIGQSVFSGCKAMEEIYLPNTMISLGNAAFIDCDNLKKIKAPKNNWFIYMAVRMSFDNVYLLKDGACLSLKGKQTLEKSGEKDNVSASCNVEELCKAFSCVEYCTKYMEDEQAEKLFDNVRLFNELGIRLHKVDFPIYEQFKMFQHKDIKRFKSLFEDVQSKVTDKIDPAEFLKIADCLGVFEEEKVTISINGRELPVAQVADSLLRKAFEPVHDEQLGEIRMRYMHMTRVLCTKAERIQGYNSSLLREVLEAKHFDYLKNLDVCAKKNNDGRKNRGGVNSIKR